MPQFSANLGFLWPDDSLADAIRAAKSAGFHAVECHFPYDEPIDAVQQSLEETGFTMLGLNTIRGPLNAGMAALPDSVPEARAAINQAFDYGSQIRALNVHVMAGKIAGEKAEKVYLDNLKYASDVAAKNNMSVLIEPLNPFDMPGYFLRDTTHACDLISTLQLTNVKLMFDCYHVGRTEGDVIPRFKNAFPILVIFNLRPCRIVDHLTEGLLITMRSLLPLMQAGGKDHWVQSIKLKASLKTLSIGSIPTSNN